MTASIHNSLIRRYLDGVAGLGEIERLDRGIRKNAFVREWLLIAANEEALLREACGLRKAAAADREPAALNHNTENRWLRNRNYFHLQAGFTLVELLVVVAIISILASLLLPMMSKAKEMARRSQCAGQLKQVALAAHMYCDDNRDYLPYSGVVSETMRWQNSIAFYLGLDNPNTLADTVYICKTANARRPMKKYGGYYLRTYGQNGAFNPISDPPHARRSSISKPSAKCFYMDQGEDPSGCSNVGNNLWWYSSGVSYGRGPYLVHDGGANSAFCDSHVKYVKDTDIPGFLHCEFWYD
jgi:prepilin-type N-terminal cleavage/methylation domain-containing protein/prepilin-type processing-associated H-X9-DG protein